MKRLFLAALFGLAWIGAARGATPLYENFGQVNYQYDSRTNPPPQIDALAFANYGVFNITNIYVPYDPDLVVGANGVLIDIAIPLPPPIPLPFDMQNTLNFTNRGVMKAFYGFRFDHATGQGRGPAASFFNARGASIEGTGLFSPIEAASPVVRIFSTAFLLDSAYLQISATNIHNEGLLRLDAQALMRLEGNRIDLSNGGLEITPISESLNRFFQNIGNTCFLGGTSAKGVGAYNADIGINDVYWGLDTNLFASTLIYNGATVNTPLHLVTTLVPPYTQLLTRLQIAPVLAAAFTNQFTPTNIIIQAVFVSNQDPDVGVDVRFYPSRFPTNEWKTPVVEFSMLESNVVSGDFFTNTIYFLDYLASEQQFNLLTNVPITSLSPTLMPTNYTVSRTVPCEFLFGQSPNSAATPAMFFNGSYSNLLVTNIATAYGWRATNLTVQLPGTPGASYSNQPGRIEITADVLKMDRTRMRAEGLVSIKTKHLESSTGARIEVERLGFDLAHTNNNLLVKDLAKDAVQQFGGITLAYSGQWTNFTGVILTNLAPDPINPMLMVTNLTTNVVEVGIHVFIVDAQVHSTVPAITHNFTTHSKNLTIDDSLRILESLSVDAENLTLNGVFETLNLAVDWNVTGFPNLLNLTNTGSINIFDTAFFGSDRPQSYASMVNRGSISAVSAVIRADYFENSGSISTVKTGRGPSGASELVSGPIIIDTLSGKFDGGTFTTRKDLHLSGGALKFRNHINDVGGALYLSVTNSLTDSGRGSDNLWNFGDGFNLLTKPNTGDLFGTTISSIAPKVVSIPHVWAAEDRGPSVAGFSNNVAIGRLILGVGFGSQLVFAPVATSNAMYVDFLELDPSVSADVDNTLAIDPNMVVYFADSNVPAEELDGQLAGRLKWVRDFAGPNSSVDVLLLDGRTVQMNRALRNSTTIDTDGDGVANGFDFYPLDAAAWTNVPATTVFWTNVSVTIGGEGQSVSLSWNGKPSTVYHVEFKPNLSVQNWQPLTSYTNIAVSNGLITILDKNVPLDEPQRYYRVRYAP